ncbi:MAG: carboxylate-amine ligase [Solirubrobacteraceae bacterium]
MDHHFTGPAYRLGVEEELMILDAESFDLANKIEELLEAAPAGEIKPELMESVLEISTEPCESAVQAMEQLRALRRQVGQSAAAKGLAIGSAGTHPFARWEDQRISARSRYRDLVAELRFVARQEVIFGVHVHVAIDDPDKAIHVANGMRVHIPVLVALSANSPFWRGAATGLASARTPIFRQFPRVGIPPHYRDWDDYQKRIEFMMNAGVIADYTYLWHDVRPHPEFGTVEIRAMDAQTRLEHSVGIAALIQALARELAEHFESGQPLSTYPLEMLDENKWLAARHGLDDELVDLPLSERVSTRQLASRLIERMHDHCSDLGSLDQLEAVKDLLEAGNGASRQQVVYEANHDLREVIAEIVSATAA